MIVLHPDDVAGFEYFEGFFAEQLVHFFVGFPIFIFVLHITKKIVRGGPDDTVAVTFVIVFNEIRSKINRMELMLPELRFYSDLGNIILKMYAGPTDPMLFHLSFQ